MGVVGGGGGGGGGGDGPIGALLESLQKGVRGGQCRNNGGTLPQGNQDVSGCVAAAVAVAVDEGREK